MKYKQVDLSNGWWVYVPEGLTPDEEANFVANRIGFVNFEQLEAECLNNMKLWEEGKTIPMESILEELAKDNQDGGQGA